MRDLQKEVILNDRRFTVRKFDALTGSYIAYNLLFKMLPLGLDKSITEGAEFLSKSRQLMTKEEFSELQMDCLRSCSEIKNIKDTDVPMPILRADGSWNIEDLSDDTMTVLSLTIHALMFNISNFFGGNALDSLLKSFPELTLSNAKTSMDTPTDPS